MAPMLRFLILLLLTNCCVWANKAGPPVGLYPTLCTDMIPSGHGYSTATTVAPYRITTTSSTYTPGQTITVTVESTDGTSEIEGVFMQARRRGTGSDWNEAIGVFSSPPTNTQLLNCGRPNSAWGQSDELDATAASVTWTAPPCDEGPIAFMATIVKGPKELFWTGVLSSEMTFTGTSSPDCGNSPPPSGSPGPPRKTTPAGGAASPGVSTLTLMIGIISSLCLVAIVSHGTE